MKTRAPLLLAGAALLVLAALVAPPARRRPADLGRPLAAPVALPFAWSGLATAARHGSPEEIVSRGRLLLQLLPRWTDWQIYLAQKLALDASARAPDTQTALDRLLAALRLLEDARPQAGDDVGDVVLAQAFLVEFRCGAEPALAEAFRRRTGEDPLEAAARYLGRAPGDELQVRAARAYLSSRMVGLALRDGDRARALAALDVAARQLGGVEAAQRAAGLEPAAENAAAHRAALGRLRRFLEGDPAIGREALARDPLLEDIVRELPK